MKSQQNIIELVTRSALDQVAFLEPANFWGGPRPADLIHLGAKYSPCMRYDLTIHALVKERRKLEAEESGCCVRRDGRYGQLRCFFVIIIVTL